MNEVEAGFQLLTTHTRSSTSHHDDPDYEPKSPLEKFVPCSSFGALFDKNDDQTFIDKMIVVKLGTAGTQTGGEVVGIVRAREPGLYDRHATFILDYFDPAESLTVMGAKMSGARLHQAAFFLQNSIAPPVLPPALREGWQRIVLMNKGNCTTDTLAQA
jgi:hypothetical protein